MATLPNDVDAATGIPAQRLLASINTAGTNAQLNEASKTVWGEYGAGRITAEEADHLCRFIAAKRPPREPSANLGAALGNGMPSPTSGRSFFRARRYQRKPDWQKAKQRQRQLGGSGALPDTIRKEFPEAQRAVLTVIGFDAQKRGKCDACIDSIAARAGVCRTTVQAAIRAAVKLGLIFWTERPRQSPRGRKFAPNLTNVIRIASRAWLRWLTRGSRYLAEVVAGFKSTNSETGSHPTKNTNLLHCSFSEGTEREKRPKEAWEEAMWIPAAP